MALIKKMKPLFLIFAAVFFAYLAFDFIERYSIEKNNRFLVIGLVFGLLAFIKAYDFYSFNKNRNSNGLKATN